VVGYGLRVDVDDHAHTVPTACRRMQSAGKSMEL
jgi:hypothetical protein